MLWPNATIAGLPGGAIFTIVDAGGDGTMASTSFWQFLAHFSALPGPHATCAMLYLVPVLIGC